jgi:AcrR family transcriptional regulator
MISSESPSSTSSSDKSSSDKSSSDKPEQILSGAVQVFLKYGYAATSMDRVALEAKVSKHTIYNHFQNKEGLFAALIERLVLRNFHLEFGCELPIDEPPQKVLRRVAEIFLSLMDNPEYIAFIRLVIAESGRFPELAILYTREVIQKGNNFLITYLKAHPELNLSDPEITARIFCGSLIAHILSQEVFYGKQFVPIDRDRLIDNLINLILKNS